ncbi:ABC transporter ATP-binding protein [Devosia sp. Leaf64]|jgi:NitT/TauT family transport system ATP-binding protein|uniref:ABC transporter ATP-binding protein n=1 Tax=Devosia sp. Leaf64 TaxID=1736229 RepID=UPI00071452EB|nr:ABC transporter ATP-binding protein [Devosia sp. Leaf64]KQN74851.1 lauroyl acyltransferase [Devosia sp. Leaf64]
MSRIVVKDVWQEYGDQVVLERISLTIEPRSFVALVGPSGCGKSTFLRLLLGDEKPTRGTITLDGAPLVAEPGPDRGVVFQRYSVFPHLTVLGNVLFGLEMRGSSTRIRLLGQKRRQAIETSRAMIAAVGLSGSEDKYPAQLSGGMQQRLALAQALVMKPAVLLLDEPFGALDPGIRAEIHELMKTLWHETALTVVMVTHDMREAFTLATRVIAFERPRDRPEERERYGALLSQDISIWPPRIAGAAHPSSPDRDDPAFPLGQTRDDPVISEPPGA